jgi:hypothetical protein
VPTPSLVILRFRAAAAAWSQGERPSDDSPPHESRPLARPPFLSDSEIAGVSISCRPGCFDAATLRRIMQEHGYAIVTDVLSAEECVELTVCRRC